MKTIGDVFKKTAQQTAKRMIQRRFPKLRDFDLKQLGAPCPSCVNRQGDDFKRRYCNYVPEYHVRIKGSAEWKRVPVDIPKCLDCEKEQLSREATIHLDRMKRERQMAPFWSIPAELAGATLKNYTPADDAQKNAWKEAAAYYSDFTNGDRYNILFRGTYGGGKSHLCKAIADLLRSKGFLTGFIGTEELLTMIKSTWGRGGDSESDIIRRLAKLDFVVLDDLGVETEGSSDWAMKKMTEIINARQGMATAYTTNLDMDELKHNMGGRVVSRLHSDTKVVDLVTDDMRIKKTRG